MFIFIQLRSYGRTVVRFFVWLGDAPLEISLVSYSHPLQAWDERYLARLAAPDRVVYLIADDSCHGLLPPIGFHPGTTVAAQ